MSGTQRGTRRLALLYEGLERLRFIELRGARIALEQVTCAAKEVHARRHLEAREGHRALAAGSRLESLSNQATQSHDELLRQHLFTLHDGRREIAALLEEACLSAGCARRQMDKLVADVNAKIARQCERRDVLAAADRHLARRDVLQDELLRHEAKDGG